MTHDTQPGFFLVQIGRDYCVSRDIMLGTVSGSPSKGDSPSQVVHLNKKVRICTPANQCGECEGDCDVDADCKSGLKCFQKGRGPSDIPGCVGHDTSKTDFCFMP